MACFTTEFILHTDNTNAVAVDSCQIGQCIWVVQRLVGYKFSMHKWNIDTSIWDTIDFKNREVIEYDNGLSSVTDFRISSSDNKLYMWRKHFGYSKICRFDTTTYEWTLMWNVSVTQPSQPEIVVLNTDFYLKSGNKTINTIFSSSTEAGHYKFPNGDNGKPNIMGLCGVDGVLFLIEILQNGRRSVVKFDRGSNTFVNDETVYDAPRSYLAHSGTGREYQTSTYAYNNKIYQRVQSKDRLMIDCFDIEAMEFHTVFDTVHNGDDVVNMSGTDKYAYIVYQRNGAVGIRVIDYNPTLETLSLITTVDHTIDNQDNFEAVKEVLPCGLREKFENMVTWKTKEWNKLKREKNAKSSKTRLFGAC